MGRRIQIDGEPEEHEEDKTIRELKEEKNWPQDDSAAYDDGTGVKTHLDDDQTVEDIPKDARVAPLPAPGKMFG